MLKLFKNSVKTFYEWEKEYFMNDKFYELSMKDELSIILIRNRKNTFSHQTRY